MSGLVIPQSATCRSKKSTVMTVSLIHTLKCCCCTSCFAVCSHIFAKARDRNALHSPSTEIPMQPVCELSLTPSTRPQLGLTLSIIFYSPLTHNSTKSSYKLSTCVGLWRDRAANVCMASMNWCIFHINQLPSSRRPKMVWSGSEFEESTIIILTQTTSCSLLLQTYMCAAKLVTWGVGPDWPMCN